MEGKRRHQEVKASKSKALLVGRTLCVIAGFIGLIGGVTNFAASAGTSVQLSISDLPSDVKQSIAMTVLVLLVTAILCMVGSACAWSAGMNPWKKEKLRSTRIELAIQALAGSLTLIEGIWIENMSPDGKVWGPVMIWAMGLPVIYFSIISLLLTMWV